MKILVIEDEHRIANSIKKGLELERFVVDVVFDGIEGLDIALSEEYTVIILDVMLPGLDGISILKKLRQQSNHTPVLLLTAKSQIDDKVAGLNAGADDYLTKPFSFAELTARIRALIRRPKQAQSDTLTFAGIILDRRQFTVTRNTKPINLSHKEFMLLDYLMSNANQILSKDQIINHVWDYNADILPNTVEVYIKNLRAKIDQPFKDKPSLIHTVRGFGYKLSQ